LVIDAMGRRSGLPGWLADLGAQPVAEEAEDSGFTYYTRYFRSADGTLPQFITGLLTPFDSFSLLTLPGDTGTWSVTVYISSRDRAWREVRHPEKWRAVVAACPLHAHLLDGEPVSDVLAMSGIVDRHRRAVVAGAPVLTGLLAVGDSACCTNPSLGRGMTMGLMHAAGTAEVINDHLGDPLALALAHDQMTHDRVTPWHQNTVTFDRASKEQYDASIEGRPAPEPTGPEAGFQQAFGVAMLYDPDVFRGMIEFISMQALPEEVFSRPGFGDRVIAAAEGHAAFDPPVPARPVPRRVAEGFGMTTDQGQITEVNGVSLYVEDHGEGTPVVLIHGWPDSAYLWRHQIPFLTQHGFRVIAPDMRGFGRSSRPPAGADYALPHPVRGL